ncbi:glycosyltransferase family 4 protein [Dehalococcoidia bacterium]|nr:glycosyltransferase family 4 protein [Dehalococcoidia bacterium]
MKVIHIATGAYSVPPIGAGGTEKVICYLTKNLSKLSCDVGIIDIKHKIHQDLSKNFTFYEVWNPPIADKGFLRHLFRIFLFAFLATLRLRKLIEGMDIIHTHSQLPAIAILLARKLLKWKTPIIHSTHNAELIMARSFFNKHLLEIMVFKKVDCVIAYSETTRAWLIKKFGVKPEKIAIVPIGTDAIEAAEKQISNALDSEGNIIFYPARICPRKNQFALIKAIPEVLKKISPVKVILAGPIEDKRYLQNIKEFSEKQGIDIEMRNEIPREDVYELYQKAKLFVFPTFSEVLPAILLEAMAFGIPVVASKIGPIEDIVKLEPGSAILIDPNNPDEIAEAIIRVLENEELRKELSRKGRKLVLEHFRWEQIANEILKVYDQVASSKD